MRYKTLGIGKNKAIKEQRNHPLPTLLMALVPDKKEPEYNCHACGNMVKESNAKLINMLWVLCNKCAKSCLT